MNRDPKHFPDFEEFRPERYLNTDGQLEDPLPGTHLQGHVTYGFGRRYVFMSLRSYQHTHGDI